MGKTPSASQQIAYILWNPSVHQRGHNSLTLVRILNQTIQNQVFPIYFLKKFAVIVITSEVAYTASTDTLWFSGNRNK